jgi:hypothetical protein
LISVAAQVARLPALPMDELWALWDEFFPQRPCNHHRDYVASRIAYKLQERAFGALSPSVRRKLENIGETGAVPNQKRRGDIQLAAGAVLVREFDGIERRVTVLPDGQFEYLGQRFRSLSAAARAITGTPWSGPLFFGLKSAKTKRVTVNRPEGRP